MQSVKRGTAKKTRERAWGFPAWAGERVYSDGDELFSELRKEINEARDSISLETYIFDRDHLGKTILEALAEAAARGVVVRLLLDGFGCSQWGCSDLHALSRRGIKTKVYHPLPWQNQFFHWVEILKVRRIVLGFWKLNRRNHRKCCIIDGNSAFVGGMNISSQQVQSEAGSSALRDTSVRVEGPAVARLREAFEDAWKHPRNLESGKSGYRSPEGTIPAVRLNASAKERRATYFDLLRRVLSAKSRVWIETPYFVPDLSLVVALRFAAWNGVDVRLIFPRDNNIWGFKWAAKAFYLPLLSAGVGIFEYKPSLLHAKVTLIDDWCTVGSSNLNQRSLLHDLEVDVVLGRAESLAHLELGFEKDLRDSGRIDFSNWKRRSIGHRILQRIALIFRRWI